MCKSVQWESDERSEEERERERGGRGGIDTYTQTDRHGKAITRSLQFFECA